MAPTAAPGGTDLSLARDPARLRRALVAAAPVAASAPERVRLVRAPGRVNLIGEHTDYNAGFVLPMAIDRGISIALVPSDDRRVGLTLVANGEHHAFDLDDAGADGVAGAWWDYIRGVAWSLESAGVTTRGFRGILASDLPIGAGLSSSAALELASAWALCGGEAPPLDPMALALAAQRAENAYVGVQTGLMDQFAVTFGVEDAAVLLDCRSLEHRSVALPRDEVVVVVCDSGVQRRLVGSEYDHRRADCERASAALARLDPAVHALRDVTPQLLEAGREALDARAYRRARHVVSENGRVLEMLAALDGGDLESVGRVLAASHVSLRDDFEVSTPELDLLVEIATSTPGVLGARLTGAGFGGCTVNLVRPDAVDRLERAILDTYPEFTGLTPTVIRVRPARGVGPLEATG
jgi:galactokinase